MDKFRKSAILKYVVGETEHICRLCLVSTEKNAICLNSRIIHDTLYCEETLTFYEMFLDLGWLHVDKEDELPQELCEKCANNVVNSHLFLRQCQYSSESWDHILGRLQENVNLTDSVKNTVQSLYLVINENHPIIYTSKKRHSTVNKVSVIKKVKTLLKYRDKYNKAKGEVKCNQCEEILESGHALSRHQTTHYNSASFCTQCAKKFTTTAKLKEHVERIHKKKTLQCSQCAKMFSTAKVLSQHEKLHHEPVACKTCFMGLPSRYALRAHLDKHEVHKCQKCKKNYLNKWTFRIHIKNCGNKNKIPSCFCDICNKGYIHKNGLRTHLKIDHGFGKVLSCSWCNKKFDAISRLKMHEVKHTRERNFYCDVCGGKFVTLAALVYHTRLHTGEKPFPCDMCNESFLSTSRRMEHKRRKHIGPQHACQFCKAKFVTRNQLRKHVERHYNSKSKLFITSFMKL